MHNDDQQNLVGEHGAGNVAGRYLTFLLADEEYGLDILKVQEIIGITQITPVPNSPHYIKGVINLRGKIIPVIDLREKFGVTAKEFDERTCFVVVNIVIDNQPCLLGVIVDSVNEVTPFPAESIEPTPEFGAHLSTSFIIGMGKKDDQGKDVVMLIDLEIALDSEEFATLEKDAEAE